MAYYKVTDSNMKSCATTCYNIPDKYKIQYKLNKVISGPDNTPLFVFNSLSKATDFLSIVPCSHPRIFECEVKRPRRIKYLSYLVDAKRLLYFFKQKRFKKKIKDGFVFSPPLGTIAVDSVKLLKDVTPK